MNPKPDPLVEHLASVPMTTAEREAALAYVAAGEGIAESLFAIARFFQQPQALTHAH